MLFKALGFDPQIVLAKAEEFERLAKAMAIELHSKVSDIDARLTRIENSLIQMSGKLDVATSAERVITAGENSENFHHEPAETPTKKGATKTDGRSTRIASTARSGRKSA